MPAVPPAEILQRRGVDTVFNHFGRDGKYYGDGTDPAGIDVVIMTRVKEYDESLDGSEMEFSRLGFQFSLRSYKMVEKSIELKHGDKLELLSPFHGYTIFHIDGEPKYFGSNGHKWICGVTPSGDKVVDPNNLQSDPDQPGQFWT